MKKKEIIPLEGKETAVALNTVNLSSRKARQEALKNKIEEINEELKSIGVLNIKYLLTGAITHPETPQNSINISGVMDISLLLRLLAYYENIQETKKRFEKEHKLPDTFILFNINTQPVHNIIHDINLRLHTLINQDRINVLTAAKTKLTPFMNEESRFVNALVEVDNLFKSLKK